MKIFINYQLKKALYEARKSQVLHCISGLVKLGMPHKQAMSLAYDMGCDLNDMFDEQIHACFERQSTSQFNDNGYQLPGFYWERVL